MKTIYSLLLLVAFSLPIFADTKGDIRALVRDKMKLERQIIKIFTKHDLGKDAGYKALSDASLAASREFTKTRRNHPKLKPFYEASDKAQKKMIDARLKGDKEAAKAAQSEFTQSRMDLERASRKVPDLKAVHEKAVEANDAAEAKKRELLATVPEGKALLDEIKAMDAKIAALRK